MKRYLVFTLKDEYYYGGFQDFDKDFENYLSAMEYGVNGIKNLDWSEFQIYDTKTAENRVYHIDQEKTIINWIEKI